MSWKTWFKFGALDGVLKVAVLAVVGVIAGAALAPILQYLFGAEAIPGIILLLGFWAVALLVIVAPIMAVFTGFWYAVFSVILSYVGLHYRGLKAVVVLVLFAAVVQFAVTNVIYLIYYTTSGIIVPTGVVDIAQFAVGVLFSLFMAVVTYYVWTKVLHWPEDELEY